MGSAGEDTNLVSHEDGSKQTNSKGKNKSKFIWSRETKNSTQQL